MLLGLILFAFFPCPSLQEDPSRLVVFTVASEPTDGYKRLIRSAELFDYNIITLGLDQKWEGGDMKRQGGGQKVNFLKQALEPLKNDYDTVVMFVDGYDVVLLSPPSEVLSRFLGFSSDLVFSAEVVCWPSFALCQTHPFSSSTDPYKFLNSGAYIGRAPALYELLKSSTIENSDDDQLYFTRLYINPVFRERYKIKLDSTASIFQNLNFAEGDLILAHDEATETTELANIVTNSKPAVLHGNGNSDIYFNTLTNYVPQAWDRVHGCTACPTGPLDLGNDGSLPLILLSIFIPFNTPFLVEFFDKIHKVDYPKDRIHLFVYNAMKFHEELVHNWTQSHAKEYLSFKQIKPSDEISERQARQLSMELCAKRKVEYSFVVDSIAHLDNHDVLRHLIQANKSVVGPMLARPYRAWSNFWGALNDQGFYARSFDYMEIVNNEKRGIWNVPYIANCYLINVRVLPQIPSAYDHDKLDSDMAFTDSLRSKGIFMFTDNRVDLGHLIDVDSFDVTVTNPELYQVVENQFDWETRYLHENYSVSLKENAVIAQPCPDVYWFPLMKPRFCKELIEVMESFGKWSSGTNHDERLAGGYESVPTRDIHMNQVNMERQWLHILQEYVRPLQEKVFIGYFHDPPKSLMNFVVRYRPDEQPSLRPHHDSSTYTINLALNEANVDYTGGGCRFIRYNCSVTNTKVGWLLMHPGRLTHFHEGLKVNSGTRYIMISFVDP